MKPRTSSCAGTSKFLKSSGVLCPRASISYQLVEQLDKKAVPALHLCRVLGVSRSGYYGSRQRAKLAPPKACLVSTQLKVEFAASGKVYGSRRLSAVLRAQGLRIGRHRVRRLMR